MNPPLGNRGDLAPNQGLGGRALLADRFDVLDTTGRLIRSVSREVAAEILDAGIAEGIGRTCVKYLRLHVEVTSPTSSSLRTWLGSSNRGRIRPAVYAHDGRACAAYAPKVAR